MYGPYDIYRFFPLSLKMDPIPPSYFKTYFPRFVNKCLVSNFQAQFTMISFLCPQPPQYTFSYNHMFPKTMTFSRTFLATIFMLNVS